MPLANAFCPCFLSIFADLFTVFSRNYIEKWLSQVPTDRERTKRIRDHAHLCSTPISMLQRSKKSTPTSNSTSQKPSLLCEIEFYS